MFYVAYATTPSKGVSTQTRAGTRGVAAQTQAAATRPNQIPRQTAQTAASRLRRTTR